MPTFPKATRQNLTIPRIEAASCPPGKNQGFIWATDPKQLGLRTTANGAKSFIFQATLPVGGSFRITLGKWGQMTIGDATALAKEYAGLVAKGIDPRDQIRERKEQAAKQAAAKRKAQFVASLTGLDAWQRYCDTCRTENGWSDRHAQDHQKMVAAGGEKYRRGKGTTQPGILYELLNRPLIDLDDSLLEDWARRNVETRRAQTQLAARLLRAFLRWCDESRPYRDALQPGLAGKRFRKIVGTPRPKSTAQNPDVLTRDDLPAWFEAVRELPNPVISTFLQALLLTGARRGELETLEWSDVDFERKRLVIRDKINRTERRRAIPLTPYCAELLRVLQLRAMPDDNWVFVSRTSKSGRISDPRIAHQTALRAAGLPHVSLHGLRRTFDSLSEWVELPTGVVAEIMGHAPRSTSERNYKRREAGLLRRWHTKLERFIVEQGQVPFAYEGDDTAPSLELVANG